MPQIMMGKKTFKMPYTKEGMKKAKEMMKQGGKMMKEEEMEEGKMGSGKPKQGKDMMRKRKKYKMPQIGNM